MSVEVWSARDHFVPLTMQAIESRTLLLGISFSAVLKIFRESEDRGYQHPNSLSLKDERTESLKNYEAGKISLAIFAFNIQPNKNSAFDLNLFKSLSLTC